VHFPSPQEYVLTPEEDVAGTWQILQLEFSNRDAVSNAENWGKPGNVGEEGGEERGREGKRGEDVDG
jgi:hypothetical protein